VRTTAKYLIVALIVQIVGLLVMIDVYGNIEHPDVEALKVTAGKFVQERRRQDL
jgi:hypothetical protein